jgi:hypothetical protein
MIAIDGYAGLARIGRGGLGDVYRATRVSTGGTVAVKVLRDVSDESVAWHRTRRELTALVALAGHANVIQLLELIELDQGPALVMEYAPGGSVGDLLERRDSTLSIGEAVLVGRHTAAALVAAHAQGIVHRDVKPQNLLIDAYGQVKLCDFGVAALTRSDDFRARTSALSMRYASPEDLDDDFEVGPSSDVYSLGATLMHLARGAPPTLRERLVPWTPSASDDADRLALDTVIASCLDPDPTRRPAAATVLDDLESLGWTLDERRRALAFELPDTVAFDDDPTLVRGDVDQTVVRRTVDPLHVDAGERLPQRPAPAQRSSALGRWIVGLLVAALVAVPVTLLWRNEKGPSATTVPPAVTSGATTARVGVDFAVRPSALDDVTDVAVVWPFGAVGECLVQVAGEPELGVVGCDEPHDLQRFLIGEFDADRFPADAPFARAEAVTVVRRACAVGFEVFTGVPIGDSVLELPFTIPSAASWDEGDRRYQCMVFAPGRRIVGDAAG